MPSPVCVLDVGTTDSDAVIDVSFANAVMNGVVVNVDVVNADISRPDAAIGGGAHMNADNGDVSGHVESLPGNVNGKSYALRVAPTDGLRELPRRPVYNAGNNLPICPHSVFFFTPSCSTSTRLTIETLRNAHTLPQDVACIQRHLNGQVIVTFFRDEVKERFLNLNSLRIGADNYTIQDIDCPLTFLKSMTLLSSCQIWQLSGDFHFFAKFFVIAAAALILHLMFVTDYITIAFA